MAEGSGGEGRGAKRLLILAALCFASYAAFAFQLDRDRGFKIATVVMAVGLLAATRLRPGARANVAIAALSLVAGVYGFEMYLTRLKPPAASAAFAAGRRWDNRSLWDVVDDSRAGGAMAYTAVQPKPFIGLLPNGIPAGGRDVIPLGGISQVSTVFCVEGGEWIVYPSDEHGFVNPRGLWGGEVELGLLGDSYTQGACVTPEASHAGRIRSKHPTTLNIGMGGNGPLLELAGIREYLSVAKPKTVLWFYFRNDLEDLNVEKDNALLMRYLDGGYRQGLIERQDAIDEALKGLVEKLGKEARRWPRAASAVGLTRGSSPIWLQDLVMGEDHTSAAAVIRLDHLAHMFHAGAVRLTRPPDWDLFKTILRQARSEVAAWGGSLVFVYLPDMWSLGKKGNKPHALRAPVLAAAAEVGLPIVDVHAAFDLEPDLEALQYHPNSHCSPAGYGVIGDVVNAWLAAHPR